MEDAGIPRKILLKCIFVKWEGYVDWTDLAQDMDRWRVVVNAVMNHLVS